MEEQRMILKPMEIENESMRIISEEISRRGITLPESDAPVVRRVIHTTADFDFLETLYFSPGAAESGMEALGRGAVVVTDTNMALSGINKAGLSRLGGSAACFMADPDVAEEAKSMGLTRAVISVRRMTEKYPGCIFACGNAPTALLELSDQMDAGFRPALVIAVPVGFVNVVEAKEKIVETCRACGVPVIAAMGRKGGSTVAAAIVNALIYKAAGLR